MGGAPGGICALGSVAGTWAFAGPATTTARKKDKTERALARHPDFIDRLLICCFFSTRRWVAAGMVARDEIWWLFDYETAIGSSESCVSSRRVIATRGRRARAPERPVSGGWER